MKPVLPRNSVRYEIWAIHKSGEIAFNLRWGDEFPDTDYSTAKAAFDALPLVREKHKSLPSSSFKVFKVKRTYEEVKNEGS